MKSLAIIYSRVRPEEKLLFAACEELGVQLEKVRDNDLILDIVANTPQLESQVLLQRSMNHGRIPTTLRFFESQGVHTINSVLSTEMCDDKFTASLVLQKAGVATIPTKLAYTEEAAIQAM